MQRKNQEQPCIPWRNKSPDTIVLGLYRIIDPPGVTDGLKD